MTRIAIGILAHVDAGKTTLCEGLLYLTGQIRTRGRVDHGDAHLDTHALERARGITIFSKQAVINTDRLNAVLIDTPGHADFSTETERTLRILDYAVLLISGADGVQAHTVTLWRLLRRYRIPTVVFINKTDIMTRSPAELMRELAAELSPRCADFSKAEERAEHAALADEALFESHSRKGSLADAEIAAAIRGGKIFPCFFGSALRLTGVREFIEALETYLIPPVFPVSPEEFGARVFKISRDAQGTRLTHLRVTGGSLGARMAVAHGGDAEKSEKIAQIRLYSGEKYTQLQTAPAGEVVAVTGLEGTYPGEGLGFEAERREEKALLSPVLSCRIALPEGADPQSAFRKLRRLSEEDPSLFIEWDGRLREIRARLMGEMQAEILKSLIAERFGLDVRLDEGRVLYKETIEAPVEGVGHYEPLRHYAEVHLLLSPLEPGRGIEIESLVSQNDLDLNWQRLILTHIAEKTHLGVLTGSPITDMRISLVAGRASLAHTEGGDFRQATYRAVRQGLMKAKSVLLEPYYSYRIELPREQLGRAIGDIRMMGGSFDVGDGDASFEIAVVTGFAPVAKLRGYAKELAAYTGGRGRFFAEVSHYGRCQNAEEVIAAAAYDPERDLENTPDSVFCAHGAGFVVRWDAVYSHMHIPAEKDRKALEPSAAELLRDRAAAYCDSLARDKELLAIFERTYGPVKYDLRRALAPGGEAAFRRGKTAPDLREYLLVDGYNIIFAWDDLRALAAESMEAARSSLINLMCNYQGVRRCELILVFDAYRVHGGRGSVERVHNINVVYTREAETADMYIEKVAHGLGERRRVRVATSDGLEQLIVLGQGARRISAEAFRAEVDETMRAIRDYLAKMQ